LQEQGIDVEEGYQIARKYRQKLVAEKTKKEEEERVDYEKGMKEAEEEHLKRDEKREEERILEKKAMWEYVLSGDGCYLCLFFFLKKVKMEKKRKWKRKC
jgi:hypothetical protein